jgi:hypothetical protein
MATRGLRWTAISRNPSAASTPISRDVSSCPARSTVSPRAMSVPGVAHILARRQRPPHFDLIAVLALDELGVLDHQHGIRTARHHAARRDRRCDADGDLGRR